MDSQSDIVGSSGEQIKRNSQWQLDTTTLPESSELHLSDEYYSSNGLNLYVIQKRECSLCRPIIPATICEKLTYLRSYVSYTSKTDAIGIRFIDYNRLFWSYLQGAFLKTLPSCYLYLFLGSYAAQHHLFLTKMAPLLHGLNIVWILIGLLQLCFSTFMQVMCLDFILDGILHQRPWNSLRPTMKKPIIYGINCFLIYNNIIWISSSLLINQIFKRNIWKMLHVAHWMLAVFFACVLLFLCYFAAISVDLSTITLQSSPLLEKRMGLDIEFLVESMTTPPILHLLTSRSNDEVQLSTDSAVILMSTTIFYLFRAYVLDRLLRYCVYINNAQWHLVYRKSNIFYLWPIFFSSVHLDSVLTIPFSILIFVVDYLTFTITHHFLIEVIVCEWQILKRWQGALVLFVLANLYVEGWYEAINWLILYATRAATCTELLIITFLYPLSRLLEDITFHNGIAASFVAVLGLRLVFLYYFIKFLYWSSSLITPQLPMKYKKGIIIAVFLIVLVALLIRLYDVAVVRKKSWKLIFVPIVDWGPLDSTLRLLRKKFDSSKYIASQAPRELSRYLIQKSEPKSYKLDARYDLQRK